MVSYLKTVKAMITATGIVIATLGGLGGLLYVLQIFSLDDAAVDTAVGGAACLALGTGLGGALAWQGSEALRNRSSALFQPPPVWVLFLPFIPAVILGQLLITFDLLPALTFPPFHILAAAIPPLAILAFAGRAFKAANIRWRAVIVQLAGGAFLSTTIAFTAEITIGLALFFTVALITALTPGGLALLEELASNLQDPIWVQNPDNLFELLVSPPVLISLIIIIVVLVPMIEELVKLLGVVLMSYRRPSRRHAFLWGLASGAGFALVENLFNTMAALELWALVIALRIGGTAMHCLGTGLTALGWQRLLVERRPWKLIGAYALSVTIHALWNVAVVGLAGTSLFTAASASDIVLNIGGGIALLLLIFLAGLTAVIVIALVVLTYRLRVGCSAPLAPG